MNTPAIIYLIDMGDQIAWCDTDSPSHEDEESVKYLRHDLVNDHLYIQTLERMLQALCRATGVDSERYDTDQADFACYEDCANEMAGLLKRSGVHFDGDENDFTFEPSHERGAKVLDFLRDIHEQETTPESGDVDHLVEILFGDES